MPAASRTTGRAWLLAAAALGPVTFVADWAAAGASSAGYSPVNDAISRLAAVGAPTRPAMTAGFVVYGVGLAAYAAALRQVGAGPAWLCAAATSVATFGVAAFPLHAHPDVSGTVHAAFASAGYVTLAALPVVSARRLGAAGRRGAARLSVGAGALSAASLALSVAVDPGHGLAQRIGLSVGDAWIVGSVAAMTVEHLRARRPLTRSAVGRRRG